MRLTIVLALLAGGLSTISSGAEPPLREGVGYGTPIRDLVVSGDCRMAIVGDSISVKNQDGASRSSTFWGVVRTWRPHSWVGVCVPSNNQFPSIQTLYISSSLATPNVKNMQSTPPGNREFSYGYERFAPAAALDVLFDQGTNVPDNQRIVSNRLRVGGSWARGDWFDGSEIAATIVHLRTPETIGSAVLQVRRGNAGFTSGSVEDRSGSYGIVAWEAPNLPAGTGDAEVRVATAGGYDESAETDHFIWLTSVIRRANATGFQLDSLAVGGARLDDWLSSGPYADDQRLGEYFEATGRPNLFYIQIGANDMFFPQSWQDDYVDMLERFEAISQASGTSPYYILVPPYGTELSISQSNAVVAAERLYDIATVGTPSIHESRIGFINLPALMGHPIDQSLLTDTIHPTAAGADLMMELGWRGVVGNAECPADLTGSSDPQDDSFSIPDGDADSDDFFFFLDGFAAQNLAVADFTGTGDPNAPGYGVPDGDCDSDDFFYYLDRFSESCP